MSSNLDRYQGDIDKLRLEGGAVHQSLALQAFGEKWLIDALRPKFENDEDKIQAHIRGLKSFRSAYQHWYSEALLVVKQLLPDRLADFVRLYETPKSRKEIVHSTYRIEDACQGVRISRGGQVIVDSSTAIGLLEQQMAIVEAVHRRFKSSLFDIKQLVQADLFDSELDAARELLKNKYARGAGAIAGVVLEGHLKIVCENHGLPKKSGTISAMNDTLKAADVIELPQFRHIQFLGDIRNKCDHRNTAEPTIDEVSDLIGGVEKIIKTIF